MKQNHSVLKQQLKISLLAIVGSLVVSNNAVAEGTVVAKVGTLGGGLKYVHPLSSKFAVGVGFNGFTIGDTLEESDINYDADLKMQNISVIGDYHPFENGFRLSAGVTHNGNKFSLSAQPTENNTIEIGDDNFSTVDTVESLDASISFKSFAPYLGIGWGHAPKSGKGWSFDADLGVLFQGSPETSLTASCVDDTSARCGELQDAVDLERESFQDSTEDFEFFPVITLGVSYTF